MKSSLLKFLGAFLLFQMLIVCKSKAQTALFNYNFQTTTLPAGITSDGRMSPTKAADGVCSQGMIQVNILGKES